VGSRLPEVDLKTFDPAELEKKDAAAITPKDVNTKEIFAPGRTIAVLTITGAFTPVVKYDLNRIYLIILFLVYV